MEANINARISADMEHSSSEVGMTQPAREHRHGDGEWNDRSPEPSSVKYRSNRLVFDRGCSAWWIRKAIKGNTQLSQTNVG